MGLKVLRWNKLPSKPLSMDLISNLSYTSSWICNISLDLYKLPCLWDDRLIFVISCTFCYKSAKVTLFALFPHPSSPTFGSTTLIDNFLQILGRFITLLVFVSQGSITDANNILYFTSHSFVMCILDMVYYILSKVWNYVGSFNNNNSSSITFFLHYVELRLDLVVFADFESPYDSCVLPFYHSYLEIVFAINLNPYNSSFI